MSSVSSKLFSLRARLLLLVALAVAPALVLELWTGLEQRQFVAALAQQDALRLARVASADQEDWIERTHQLLVGLAQLPSVRDLDPAGCAAALVPVHRHDPTYTALLAVDPNGNLLCSSVPLAGPVNLADWTSVRRAIESGDFAVGDFVVGRLTGKAALSLALPVFDLEGRPRSVLIAGLDLAWLNGLAAEARLPEGSVVVVLDAAGTVLARYPEPERWVGTSAAGTPLFQVVEPGGGEGTFEAAGLDGRARLYAYAPLGVARRGNPVVVVGIPTEVAFDQANMIARRDLTGLALVALVALLAAWCGGEFFLLRRLRTLLEATKRLAAGDFTARCGLHRPDELGELGRAFDALADALERQQAERESSERQRALLMAEGAEARQLAEVRALYEATALNLVDGLAIMDREDRVVFWNPRMEVLFGLPRAGAVGRPITEVTAGFYTRTADPTDTTRRAEEARLAALDGRVATFAYTLAGRPTRDLTVLVFPVAGADGAFLGHGRLVRDVTREREVERLKDELVGVVSHELRTPLASIVGFAELLLMREHAEEERREFLGIMVREGKRLTELINDFLDLQRMEQRPDRLQLAPVDLNDLVAAMTAVGQDAAHPVVLDIPERLPLVQADPDRLTQVLTNLISNARKYSPRGGEVRISARCCNGVVEVCVEDEGLGIPPKALPRLFEKFYRVDNSDRRAIKGTGLGLAICRTIVGDHGGRIWAESDGPGQGSRFRFTLPVAAASAAGHAVLLVEDDANFARLLRVELAARGLSAHRVASAEEALRQAEAARPEAVILDLRMPGMGGEALLPRLRELGPPALPVFVVTVEDLDPGRRREFEVLGVVAVFKKGPSVAVEAAAAVAQLLTQRRAA